MKKLKLSLLCAGMLAASVGTSVGLEPMFEELAFKLIISVWPFYRGVIAARTQLPVHHKIGNYGSLALGAAAPMALACMCPDDFFDKALRFTPGSILTSWLSYQAGYWGTMEVRKLCGSAPVPAVVTPASTAIAAKVAVWSKSKMGEKLFANVKKMTTFLQNFGF